MYSSLHLESTTHILYKIRIINIIILSFYCVYNIYIIHYIQNMINCIVQYGLYVTTTVHHNT